MTHRAVGIALDMGWPKYAMGGPVLTQGHWLLADNFFCINTKMITRSLAKLKTHIAACKT